MGFSQLVIHEWKQFHNLEIDFHPRMTILTGANGSGKTTILNLLGKHVGWGISEMATPAIDEDTGLIRFFERYFKKSRKELGTKIGTLTYSSDRVADLSIPSQQSPAYDIRIDRQEDVPGIYIRSHGLPFTYSRLKALPLEQRNKQLAFDLTRQAKQSSRNPAIHPIKETLLHWAIFGEGSPVIVPDPELKANYRGFENVLKKILPPSLGFKNFSVRKQEIVLVTDSGEWMIDAASGGVGALIELVWQIYTSHGGQTTVLIDEIESHLHPAMQRTVLSDLLAAFPDVQFIVATHSPLIVGSVEDSAVYALRYNEERKVNSVRLDLVSKAKTATEILHEVLGVPFTMPVWAERALEQIVLDYANREMTQATFSEMREELAKLGLESLMPLALKKTLNQQG